MKTKRSELNRITLNNMKSIYYDKKYPYIDWMGYLITEENKPSYHHIIKQADLKKEKKETYATVENGAYLGKHSHEMLHHVEIIDKESEKKKSKQNVNITIADNIFIVECLLCC